jgi:asparagine synthase (glutamine-hydrolysing)
MCGIAGIVTSGRLERAAVGQLIGPIAHRGPDGHGVWIDSSVGVGLGHRRLAIVDLSPSGSQPMKSSDGRFVITFNGEIYNHTELRRELEDSAMVPPGGWRGHSDTEVLVAAISAWGLEKTLSKSVGMFAFGLWDRREKILCLVRDRFGEKPLYYGHVGGDFLFASEIKALRAHPNFANPVDREALRQFVHLTWIPAPLTIYEGIFKLPPGCILKISTDAASRPLPRPPAEGLASRDLSLSRYWSYRDVVLRDIEEPITDEADALDELERLLSRVIQGQSMADVPVGAFLSGGIDSSTIVALYQKYSPIPVRTYSIGFEEAGFNEAADAKRIATHLGTVHHEHYVTLEEARDVIPLLPAMYDEPFADSSQIPTYLVSRFARRDVTVALTGDGGDEMFAGYNRHFAGPQLWNRMERVPPALRHVAAATLGRLPSSFWSGAASVMPRRSPHLGAKIRKALRVAGRARSFGDVYDGFLDEWTFGQSPVIGGKAEIVVPENGLGGDIPEPLRVMYRDAVGYLPDDVLCKVDRASMATSLETRAPYLDHRVAELAARIPLRLKIRNGRGKYILRELLYREAPRELFERPKVGFSVPVGEWIRGPLRPWAEALLDSSRMSAEGWLDPAIVHRRWNDHVDGRQDSTAAIWAILTFQAWLREQQVQPNAIAA